MSIGSCTRTASGTIGSATAAQLRCMSVPQRPPYACTSRSGAVIANVTAAHAASIRCRRSSCLRSSASLRCCRVLCGRTR
eukprot:6012670-Prymnesium_polylepis.1